MNKHSLLFFMLCSFFAGCNKAIEVQKDSISDANSETIRIATKDIPDFSDISDRIKEVKLIPLNEEDGKYIVSANKVLIHNDNYVIVDKEAINVLVFDREGNFKNQLTTIGRGPGEIIHISDVWVNEEGRIEVYDFGSRRLVTYNSDYSYKGSISTGKTHLFASVSPIPGSDTYVGHSWYNMDNPPYHGKNYQLTWLSREFTPGSAYAMEYDAELKGVMAYQSGDPFVRYKDSLRYCRFYDSSIYHVGTEGQLSRRYVLDYGSNQFPEDYETSIFLPNAKLLKGKDLNRDYEKIGRLFEGYFLFAGSWLETQNHVMFESENDKRKTFVSLYDKGKKEVIAQGRVFQDSKVYHMYLPFPNTVEDSRFVSVLPGVVLAHYIDDPRSPFYNLVREKEEEKSFIVEYTLK